MTNITDEGAYRGATITKLVDDHDRGCLDYYTPGDSTPAAPTLTSIAPTTGTSASGATVTFTGTGFRTGAQVRQDGHNVGPATFVSATSLTRTLVGKDHATGTIQLQIVNPDGDTTAAKPFTVT
jgi:hypothetical protein